MHDSGTVASRDTLLALVTSRCIICVWHITYSRGMSLCINNVGIPHTGSMSSLFVHATHYMDVQRACITDSTYCMVGLLDCNTISIIDTCLSIAVLLTIIQPVPALY